MTRYYPENFAGIIAAIQDLGEVSYKPGAEEGEKPPGGEIIIDPDTGFPIWIIIFIYYKGSYPFIKIMIIQQSRR